MAVPTSDDLATLDYARLGEPFCVAAVSSLPDPATLDLARLAEPFVAPAGASGNGANMVISPVVPR